MSRRYYASLDGLRGIAVGIVLLAHAGIPGLRSGAVGVDIFFTLSGYLITSILLNEYDRFGGISIKNFYVRRILRLTPCLWMTVCAYFLLSLTTYEPYSSQALTKSFVALTYTMNWARAFGFDGGALGHTWSLAIEEQFYLVWPLATIALNRWGRSHREQGLILVVTALALAAYRYSITGAASAKRIYFGLDTHADGLLIGSALAYFLSSARLQDAAPAWRGYFAYALTPVAVLSLMIVIGRWTWADSGMSRYGYAAAAVCSALLLIDLVGAPRSLLRGPLSFAPLVWVGRLSYGIYLWHFPIYKAIHQWAPTWGYKRLFVAGMAATLLVAPASYYLVERRFLSLKERFSRTS